MEQSENTWYKTVVKTSYEDAKGNTKYKKFNYFVQAVSPTDVDKKIAEEMDATDYEVTNITVTKIEKVIF